MCSGGYTVGLADAPSLGLQEKSGTMTPGFWTVVPFTQMRANRRRNIERRGDFLAEQLRVSFSDQFLLSSGNSGHGTKGENNPR